MKLTKNSRIEKTLRITEYDIVNKEDITVLVAYAIKENDDMWSYPAPQIFSDLYYENKYMYDAQVTIFRNECEVI